MTGLEFALEYARMGFAVFPIACGFKGGSGNYPLGAGWPEYSTSDIATIQRWSASFPGCNWGLDCGKSDLLVVDVDCKPGQNGWINWQKLLHAQGKDEPFTRTHRTSGNGFQYLFRGASPTKKQLDQNIDIKSSGGYVVMPGSSTIEIRESGKLKQANGSYIIQNPADVAPLPEWLKELATRQDREKAPVIEGVIEDGSRNNMLASFAGTMRSRGANFDTILAALLTMNETMTSDPVTESEVELIARSVSRYEPDQANSVAEFMRFEERAESHAHSFWGGSVDASKLCPPDWLIKGRFVPGYLTVTAAPPGVGKSRIALLEGVAVATGKPISGMAVRKSGTVWYISEDPIDDLKERFIGICKANEIDHTAVNVLMTSLMLLPLRLLDKNGSSYVRLDPAINWLTEQVKSHNIRLLILDPYTRLHNCDENDNRAADIVTEILQKIGTECNCAIHIIHHTGKGHKTAQTLRGNMDALRGASALAGAARVIWTVDNYSDKLDGDRWDIPSNETRQWIRLDPAKCNIALLDESDTPWFRLSSFKLPCHTHDEDSVGVAVAVKPQERDQVECCGCPDDFIAAVAWFFDANQLQQYSLNALAEAMLTHKWAEVFYHVGMPLSGCKTKSGTYSKLEKMFEFPVDFGGYRYELRPVRGKPIVRTALLTDAVFS